MDDARDHEETVRAMIDGSLSVEDDEAVEAELAALEALEAEAEAEAEADVEEEAEAKEVEAEERRLRLRRRLWFRICRTCRRRRRTCRTRPSGREPTLWRGRRRRRGGGEMEAVAA
jgi:hypothetical protein